MARKGELTKTKYAGVYKNNRTNLYDTCYSYKVYDVSTKTNRYKQHWTYGFKTLAEARQSLANEQSGGIKQKSEAITLQGAYELWKLQATSVKSYSPVTLKNTACYMGMISQFISLDTKISDITDDIYMKLCADIKNHGYSGETIHNLFSTIRKLCNLCYRKRLIEQNPLDFVEPMSTEWKDKDTYRLVTKQEFDKIDEWLENHSFIRLGVDLYPKHRVCMTILYYTGMRIGEVLALTPDDISAGRISVTKSYVSDIQLVKSPKNFKHRVIPVPVFVTDLITDYISTYEIEHDARLIDVSHGAVDSVLKKICKDLDIESISCHCFRHTYISNLIRSNRVSLAQIEKYSGDTQQTILSRYSNAFVDDDSSVIDVLESL